MRKLYTGLSLFLISLFFTFSSHSQTTYNFTSAGASGRMGPTQAQVDVAYGAGHTLHNSIVISTPGIQEWTVPLTSLYRITAAGAGGGGANEYGGRGRIVQGEIQLIAGQKLKVLVGQKGGNGSCGSSGGGGGSFVVKLDNSTQSPLIVGGGGAGFLNPLSASISTSDASFSASGQNSICNTGVGGNNGTGGKGSTDGWGSGGGGYLTNGTESVYTASYGFSPSQGNSFINGGAGGNSAASAFGGFGGGGGTHGCTGGGGGGGGYSGGGGSNQDIEPNAGGGGGSYLDPALNKILDLGFNTSEGYVMIVNIFNGGTISNDQTLCGVSTPALLNSTEAASGLPVAGYQWQRSSDNISWEDINSATDLTYQAPVVSEKVYFRRKVTSTVNTVAYSNTITITVNPIPSIAAIASQVLCNGSTSTAISFSGTVNGTDYSWTNSDPSIGLAASGTGDISAFAAVNTGMVPITATITITPSFTANGNTCTGTPTTFTVTVNPTSTVGAIADAVYCNNSAVAANGFSTPATGGTTTYSWTSSTDIGFGTSGNGDVAAYIATNTGNAAITATITVTPSFTNNNLTCSGTRRSFTVKVNPTPAATFNYAGSPYCYGAGLAKPTFTGTAGGTYSSTTGLIIDATTGIVDLDASTSGNYTVTYTIAAAGGCAQAETTTTVVIKEKTAITIQPAATQTVCEATSVSFSVNAKGSAVAYQWRKGSQPIANATAATYKISNPVIGDAGMYNVVVTGDCGVITSSDAKLIVNPTTAIITEPVAEVRCVGSSATFSVVAKGTALHYQWRKGTTAIEGATNATYTIPSVNAADAGDYNVVVTGTCNVVTSTDASLTVNTLTAVSTQPVAKTICSGNSVTFNVVATGTGLSYQWRKGSIAIAGANSATFTISSTLVGDAGNYDVVVTGACGFETSVQVPLTVNATPVTPTITASGVTTFCAGGNVVLTSSAFTGNQWYKDGSAIIGADGSTYTVTSSGAYTVRTTANACPSAMSAATVVNVTPLPAIPVISVTGNKLTSSAPSDNQWLLNNTPINGATNSIYIIRSSGLYTVQVTQNGCSSTSGVLNFVATSIGNPSIWNGEVSVYPNPAIKTLYIKNAGVRKLQVQLFDVSGLKVYEAKVLSTQGIVDMQGFASGTYHLRITDVTKNETIQKTIIKL